MTRDAASSFDGEYGLAELLPMPLAARMCAGMEKGGGISVAVLFPDKTRYFPEAAGAEAEPEALRKVLPIVFESETVGWLSLSAGPEPGDGSWVERLGEFFLLCLSLVMTFRYRELAMADLHGAVVEDSYASLQKKIAQLEESEARYKDLAGNLEGIVLKKSEEIQKSQALLMHQEKMASIGRLAAGVAHEINNPTGFILSNLYTLKEYEEGLGDLVGRYGRVADKIRGQASGCPDWAREDLEAIDRAKQDMDLDFILSDAPVLIRESRQGAERIKKIVADLKEFARPGDSDFKHADINANLDLTLSVMANELKYNVTVIRRYQDLPEVMCRPNHLNQVFLNILSNAAQSIKERGEITIETQAVDGRVVISISDTGCGIPAEDLPRVFDPFFSTKEVGRGKGLGLNMAYNIIKNHGGGIEVTSRVGQGTRFVIHLPVEPPGAGVC